MAGEIKTLGINKIVNYYGNPRHAEGQNENDTLKKLFEAVGVQYMLNLAKDIMEYGLLPNQQIVVVFSEKQNKYVVYEGNRRIAAIKLLLNPDFFTFLDQTTRERARKIAKDATLPSKIKCYVTDENEALFIMERVHSGEDKGRGLKQWTSREKETFRVRRKEPKKISYLIDLHIKKYFDGTDITAILPFTTIQRIFNNREVKNRIGLDVSNEATFTRLRMQLVLNAAKKVAEDAEQSGVAVTRLYNKSREIEDRILPWIDAYMDGKEAEMLLIPENNTKINGSLPDPAAEASTEDTALVAKTTSTNTTSADNEEGTKVSKGKSNNPSPTNKPVPSDHLENKAVAKGRLTDNTPYFFQGLQYTHLDPNDADTHGVVAVCKELEAFSQKKLVASYPIAATFLMRSLIEQSIVVSSQVK